MVYVTVPETAARVKHVADRLGLQHRGVHNAGPAWYGDAATVVAVGNLSVPLLYHLLDEHFEKNPDGTWRQNWAQGEVRRRCAWLCFSDSARRPLIRSSSGSEALPEADQVDMHLSCALRSVTVTHARLLCCRSLAHIG